MEYALKFTSDIMMFFKMEIAMANMNEIIEKLLEDTPGILDLNKLSFLFVLRGIEFITEENMNDEDFDLLLDAISTNDSIHTLIFADAYPVNPIEARSLRLEQLLNAIKRNPKISHFVVDHEHLDGKTDWDESKFTLLMDVIEHDPYLKKLSILGKPDNGLVYNRPANLREILLAISNNPNIVELHLPHNQLGWLQNFYVYAYRNLDIYYLSTFTDFIKHSTLRSLDLSNNSLMLFDGRDFSQFTDAITNNHSLVSLDLSYNNLGFIENDSRFLCLIQAIEQNQNILYVKLEPQNDDVLRPGNLSKKAVGMVEAILLKRRTVLQVTANEWDALCGAQFAPDLEQRVLAFSLNGGSVASLVSNTNTSNTSVVQITQGRENKVSVLEKKGP